MCCACSAVCLQSYQQSLCFKTLRSQYFELPKINYSAQPFICVSLLSNFSLSKMKMNAKKLSWFQFPFSGLLETSRCQYKISFFSLLLARPTDARWGNHLRLTALDKLELYPGWGRATFSYPWQSYTYQVL